MCGIAGFVAPGARDQAEKIVRRMTEVISHRGPDGTGIHIDGPVALGHRRLSIIDVAAGHQPMANEDGSIWIVYNGEIFNHAAIRPELEQAGHRYATHCDTETILHAYEQDGPACVRRFRGMFAFAIWDQPRQRLICARDRLGIKPFYYFWNGSTFIFASEIKALREHPLVSTRFRQECLAEYLSFGYSSGAETMLEGIHRLPPGHTLTFDLRNPRPVIEPYWDVPAPPAEPEKRTDEDWIAELRARFEETVRMRLMSDVPLGVFLSGGVDSSALAAMMQRLMPGRLKSFSVGYDEDAYSELSWARQVSSHLDTDHHEVRVGFKDFFGALPKLIWHEDEPLVWPSSVSLYFVSQLASREVKVVLTGEGSDELFGGYARYQHWLGNEKLLPYYQWLPGAVRSGVREFCRHSALLPADLRRKLEHTVLGRESHLDALYLDNYYSAFDAGERDALLPEGLRSGAYQGFHRYWDNAPGSTLDRLLYADQKTYLVELLMKQDQMSMAASIESRVPFLDHTFVEFSRRVPASLKIRGGEGKYIFKRAVGDLLPENIIYRTKMGFPTPLRQWFRQPEAAPLFEKILDPKGQLAGMMDLRPAAALIERHRSGLVDGTDRCWRLLTLQLWCEMTWGGKPAEEILAGAC